MSNEAGVRRSVSWVQGDPAELPPRPTSTKEALDRLHRGNRGYAHVGAGGETVMSVSALAFGLPAAGAEEIEQVPFVATLSCSDARVPIELVFGQAANNVFAVRVAGNIPSSACLGSLHYAVAKLPTVQVVVVVGHAECGAVSAAVDAAIDPQKYLTLVEDAPLRSVVDPILAGVRIASLVLAETEGGVDPGTPAYRDELVRLATLANAAITALVLGKDLGLPVYFGVHDLHERTVGLDGTQGWEPGLVTAPVSGAEVMAIMRRAAKQK